MNPNRKNKPIISASHAINWYYGNYLMNINNALEEEEELMYQAYQELESMKIKLAGKTMTHREFLDFIKVIGFHGKYYRYQKPKLTDCPLCRAMGIKY